MGTCWSAIESSPEAAAALNWRAWLGPDFETVAAACLRRTERRVERVPCPNGCGCSHRVRPVAGGFVGVCDCGEDCEDIPLKAEDVVVWELNMARLGRAVAKAFGCDVKEAEFGLRRTRQVGSFSGAALAVVLTIPPDQEGFRNVVGQLVARQKGPFILLAPTSRCLDGISQGLLTNAKAGFFDLESHVTLLPSGALQAHKSGGELFSKYLPDAKEPVPEDVARQVFALLKELESEGQWRKAPPTKVFRLYCQEGLSRAEVAKKCDCVDSLVTLRLKQIRLKTGRDPKELRQLSGHFQKIEDSLSDPRAKKVRGKSAIDDDRFGDEGRDG